MILDAVVEFARSRPDRSALVCGDDTIRYGELAARVAAAAAFLAECGLARGERALLAARPDPAFVYGYLACHWLGAVAVPFDPKLAAGAVDDLAARVEARLRFDASALGELERSGGGAPRSRRGLEDAADILFTTGSTGRPKGVVQTHGNLLAFARARNAVVGPAAAERLVLPLPLSHGFGLGRLRATLLAGGAVVLVDGLLPPARLLAAFEGPPAGFCCVPAGFAALFALAGDALGDFADQVLYVETATAPLPAEHRDRLLALLPRSPLYNTYGLTETTSSFAYVDLRAEPDKSASVGKPIPEAEVRVVADDGGEAAAGETGSLWIRGPGVMAGYWREPERTAQALKDGWLVTSDLVSRDADGFLYFKGRKDDLINVGGLKVSPLEVERALEQHPAVLEAACIGVDDPARVSGQAIEAYLVARPGRTRPSPAELAHFVRERLEPAKTPACFFWVEALPKGATGKLLRRLLRRQAAERAKDRR